MGELLFHQRRILSAAERTDGRLVEMDLSSAFGRILDAADGKAITILLDGNVPCEQMAAAAAWCKAWPQAKLCLAIAPADEQLLLGAEAGGAEYLPAQALSECDGFVVIGDAFASNPTCARGVFDRRKAEVRTPLVVIDPAAGTAAKFATHLVAAPADMELAVLSAVAKAAGVDVKMPGAVPTAAGPSATSAGRAIAQCKRLGVLIAAEHGRSRAWRQIGYLAGQLAKALGGGLAPQTVGANALAAVRLAAKLQTISLAEAMSPGAAVRVVIGCDVLGMLGWAKADVLAAAAPLPNRTTDVARVLLPAAMPGEYGGTYLLEGSRRVQVAPLAAAPKGVPTPGEIVAELAERAGVSRPDVSLRDGALERRSDKDLQPVPAREDQTGPVLLLAREAIHGGSDALTAHASWQAAARPVPQLRVSPVDAQKLRLSNLAEVTVSVGGNSVRARVRLAPELPAGILAMSEGSAQARALVPCAVDSDRRAVVASPVSASVSP